MLSSALHSGRHDCKSRKRRSLGQKFSDSGAEPKDDAKCVQ